MSASQSPHVNSPLIDTKDVTDETDLVVPTSVTSVSAVHHHVTSPRRFEPATPVHGRRWKPLLYQDFVCPRGKKGEERDGPPEPFR
ncbi:hypothetical protein NP493_171g01016 [Ridgeia piscesae]|uniref:Uncharacterized protein n=1 Tax=Ridgeia piscesae TaxID=27915 RepID=A0AAD9P3D8_RIDPI|nr:hypothetical protein NP493_171g01016 [Ridgeia piscesae]